jgi:hypothetical protein
LTLKNLNHCPKPHQENLNEKTNTREGQQFQLTLLIKNGNKQGDEEGELTYIGSRGETVIDYAIVNEAAWERVEEFKVGKRVDYDHLPLEITIEGTNQEEKGKGGAEDGDNKSMG